MKLLTGIIVLLTVFFATCVSAGDHVVSTIELAPVLIAPDCRIECFTIVKDIADVIETADVYVVNAEVQFDGVDVALHDVEARPHVVLTVLKALGKAALKGVANIIQHVV